MGFRNMWESLAVRSDSDLAMPLYRREFGLRIGRGRLDLGPCWAFFRWRP